MRLVSALLIGAFGIGCGSSPASEPPVPTEACSPTVINLDQADVISRLEVEIERARMHYDAAGVAFGVERADHGVWVGATGQANVAGATALQADDIFRIGSVTKTFTAALTFQLRDEGRLTLDDPLEDWVPGYWDGHGITVRDLLGHTSGIVSYNWVGNFDKSRAYTPIELVEWAHLHGPQPSFPVGTDWAYSNTAYVMLGMIAEQATGKPYEQLVRERFFEPLGLTNTFVEGNEALGCGLIRGHEGTPPVDVTDQMDATMGWAAGAIASNARDVARWGSALYGGEVLTAASLREMTTEAVLPNGTRTGWGLGSTSSDDGTYGAFFGHTGGSPGFQAYMSYMEDSGTTMVALVNQIPLDIETVGTFGWAAVLDLAYDP